MSNDENSQFLRVANPILWGLIATILVVVFGIWASQLPNCVTLDLLPPDCGQSKWETFLTASPNEIGDTLAGFAGALAFVWLIATVWLQSQELAAQRKELALTRKEYSEHRKASEEMAKSISSQSLLLERASLREQNRDRQRLIQAILSRLRSQMEAEKRLSPPWKVPDRNPVDNSPTVSELYLFDRFPSGEEIDTALPTIIYPSVARIHNVVSQAKKPNNPNKNTAKPVYRSILMQCEMLVALAEKMGEETQIYLQTIAITDLHKAVSLLLVADVWAEEIEKAT